MRSYSKWFIRIAVIYSIIGAVIGSDMAGRKDYSLIPVHSHILVVGWLTLFVYGLFYYVFPEPSMKKTAKVQSIMAILGGMLLPVGMFVYNNDPSSTFALMTFIITGSLLLIGMGLFGVMVFFDKKLFADKK